MRICLRSNLAITKVPEVARTISFYPKGAKLSLFSLHWQWFPRYVSIFKIVIFGHETWPLAKVPEVAHKSSLLCKILSYLILSFYPRGSKSSLFSLYGHRFPRYTPISKIALFRNETWPLAKVTEIVHIISF